MTRINITTFCLRPSILIFAEKGTDFVSLFVMANVEKYPIYNRDIDFPIEGYRWTNVGLLKKLVKVDDDVSANELRQINDPKFANFKYNDFGMSLGYSQYLTTHIKEHYYFSLEDLTKEFLKLNDNESALFYAKKAEELLPNKKEAYIFQGNIYFELKNCEEARNNYLAILEIDDRDWRAYSALSNLYKDCFVDSARFEEYRNKAEEFKPKDDVDLETF